MNNVTSGLKSVNELLDYNYFIPSYQRGYRWKEHQVKDLLNDIYEFFQKDKSNNEEFYCLQPIVVSDRGDGQFTVIDGQQRLTTILIILKHLEGALKVLFPKKSLFEITYETRDGSTEFIQKLDSERKEENIDYFHMCEALQTIQEWFEENDSAAGDFLTTMLRQEGNNVRVIWYQVDGEIKPIDLFTRLNIGKIQLTNAELIKALFLSKHNLPETEVGDGRRDLRQREIATEWDTMENTLRKEEFWFFLQNSPNSYDNHIELLFDIQADTIDAKGQLKEGDKYHTFRYFNDKLKDSKDSLTEWDDVKSNYQKLHDWFTDDDLYHIVGFLISAGDSLKDLLDESEEKTKTEFSDYLKGRIKQHVPAKMGELTYQDDKKVLRKVLLLFNVLSIIANKESNLRFQFGRYKKEKWDIEHVHSVTSDSPTSKAHQLDWIKEVQQFTEDGTIQELIVTYLSSKDSERDFNELYEAIVKRYSEDGELEDINDISNLTLLDMKTNRGYKNAVFPVKRKKIIEKDEKGTFVPLCTKNVFLKYYNRNLDQTTFWGRKDRETYKDSLLETITNFLNPVNNG